MDSTAQWRLYKSAQLSARSQAAAAFALETCLHSLDTHSDSGVDADIVRDARASVTLALKHLYSAIEDSRHLVPHIESFAQHVFVENGQDNDAGPTGASDRPELASVCHVSAWEGINCGLGTLETRRSVLAMPVPSRSCATE
jgi:hypothetical protein